MPRHLDPQQLPPAVTQNQERKMTLFLNNIYVRDDRRTPLRNVSRREEI
jgi:hypothetical protein